jgi:hypothetical protein
VIKDLTLSTVSKAKLRKLVKALGAPAPEETSGPVPSFLQKAGDKAPTEEGTAAYDAQDDEKASQAFTAAKSKNDDRPLRCIQSVEIVRDDELDLQQETETSHQNVDDDHSSSNCQKVKSHGILALNNLERVNWFIDHATSESAGQRNKVWRAARISFSRDNRNKKSSRHRFIPA